MCSMLDGDVISKGTNTPELLSIRALVKMLGRGQGQIPEVGDLQGPEGSGRVSHRAAGMRAALEAAEAGGKPLWRDVSLEAN